MATTDTQPGARAVAGLSHTWLNPQASWVAQPLARGKAGFHPTQLQAAVVHKPSLLQPCFPPPTQRRKLLPLTTQTRDAGTAARTGPARDAGGTTAHNPRARPWASVPPVKRVPTGVLPADPERPPRGFPTDGQTQHWGQRAWQAAEQEPEEDKAAGPSESGDSSAPSKQLGVNAIRTWTRAP